ncbi:MAG: cyanophycinase [Gemmataceae bacterium]
MRKMLWTAATWILLTTRAIGAEPFGPAGIRGTLIVGTGDVAKAEFLKQVGKAKANTLLISATKPSADVLKAWTEAANAKTEWITPEKAAENFGNAEAAWFEDGRLEIDERLGAMLRTMLHRGGSIGIAQRKPIRTLLPEGADRFRREGRTSPSPKRLAEGPGRFRHCLSDDGVLVIRDRDIKMLEGFAKLGLAASEHRPLKIERLTKKNEADLNQWRRAALARTAPPYPPVKLEAAEVKKGTLIIIGGGGMPKGGLKRFIELAGGPDAPIVVLPTSMPDPLPKTGGDAFLLKAGAKNVAVINARERKDVEDPANLELLRKARGIWFGGGRQWRFVDAYEGTKAYPLIHDVLARGGVIAGSSAGATIQGDYLVRGSPLGPNIMMAEGYEKAFGFLPGVAIDQHFAQRKRFGDMTALMKTYPQYLGIGLDEATAIVVSSHIAEVIGPGEAHFYDATKKRDANDPDHDSYKAGTRYDLKKRAPIEEVK